MPRSRLPRLSSIRDGSFEPSKRNPISLRNDEPIDLHLKQLKIGEDTTPLELSKTELRINGDLFLDGKLKSHKMVTDNEYLEIESNNYIRFMSGGSSGHLDIYVNAGTPSYLASGTNQFFLCESQGTFNFGNLVNGSSLIVLDTLNQKIQIKDSDDTGDLLTIQAGDAGASTISTTDDDGVTGHLTLDIDGNIELNADGGTIDFKDASVTLAQIMKQTSGNEFYLHSAIGTANYLRMYTTSNGESTIVTVDSDGTAGHLTLAPNGILKTEADDGGISVKETADAGTDTAGYGQVWVHDTTPNELCFTDDAGTDIVGIGKYHYETKFIGYLGSGTASYLPINGYIFDQTSTSGRNEYHSFLAPYNGTIQKVAFRSEVAQDGDLSFRVLESADGTEIPSSTIFRHETTVDIADDIYQELDMTSPSTGSDYAPLTKGRIYVFYLSCPSAPLDTNITIVFKWDITS